jgi:hypothetical protein
MKQFVASAGHVTFTVAGPATTTLLITSNGIEVDVCPSRRWLRENIRRSAVSRHRYDSTGCPAFLRKIADYEETTVRNLDRQRASRRDGRALKGTGENTDRGRTKNRGDQASHADGFHSFETRLVWFLAQPPLVCRSPKSEDALAICRDGHLSVANSAAGQRGLTGARRDFVKRRPA